MNKEIDLIKKVTSLFLKRGRAVDSMGRPLREELCSGVCYYWAYVFLKVLGGKPVSLITKKFPCGGFAGHAVVYYKGKYFDGENPQGCKDPHQLINDPRSETQVVKHSSLGAYVKYWKIDQHSYKSESLESIMCQVANNVKKDLRK